jgi:hypothetical protein
MCDRLEFVSNNGNSDSWTSLKHPKNESPVSYRTQPKGTLRSNIGTTVRLFNVDPNKSQNVCDNLEEIAKKYCAKLAKQDLKLCVIITEEDNSKTEQFLRAPEKISKLFELPIQKVRAAAPLIEFVGVSSKEKKILICVDWILIREIIPPENVFGIVNCNEVNVTRDRRSIVTNDNARTYSTELKNYTATHFEKASQFDNMKAKDKEEFIEMLKKINELAMPFLKPQPLPPTASSKGIANSTSSNKSKYLRTPKKNPHAVEINGGEEIYIKPRQSPTNRTKTHNEIKNPITRKPPVPNFEKPINDILVKRQIVKDGTTAVAIAVQVEDINRKRHEGLVDIEFIPYDNEPSQVIPQYDADEQKATIIINEATAYYKKIKGTPQFWRSLAPMIAEGFASIKLMAEGKEQIGSSEFLREVGKTFSAIWGVFK